ncbi:hypothetical protein [Hymenobacter wooponensis]|uniref:XRE family transcriptional regulator n=1 Tax=Hymenobacter wooponensis TaxID=1525360 RepID=A0A4Z0MHL7_9BACT|nr:hypothetical protein [Hymenobacter wooponensis]TGD79302.1 hypothetical protein EU557_13755 [Hymenobacter wooponensis]
MENNTTVGQRFLQLISHLGISKNAFAASLDKTATVIQHLVDERNKPGFDLLCKVFEVYPNVSKDWLLQGLGPMLSSGDISEKTSTLHSSSKEVVAAMPTASVSAVAPPVELTPVVMPTLPAPEAAPEQPAPANSNTAPLAPQAPLVSQATLPQAPAPDTSWQTALYTQQMAHQLAMAELRNQHLQDQQRLMQQMMDLMQRQLSR